MFPFKTCGSFKVWTAALSPCLTPSTTESASGERFCALVSAELGQSMVLSMIGKEEGLSAFPCCSEAVGQVALAAALASLQSAKS